MRISDWSSDVCSSDLEQHVARSERAGERLAALKTDEAGAGQARFEPVASRPLADHDDLVRNAAAAQRVDRVGEDVEPLFHDQPAKEADDRRVVVDAELAPPNRIRSEEHTSELQSLIRISFAVFRLKKK